MKNTEPSSANGTRVTAIPPAGLDVPALYSAYWQPMVRLAYLLVDDSGAAEDAVQDAFVAVYRARDRLLEQGAAVSYLRTTVVNRSRSFARRRGVAGRHRRELLAPDAPPAEATVLLDARDAELAAAISRLPDRQREAIVLRYWAELSEAEIATTLGISVGTVKSSASKALAALRSSEGSEK